MIVRVTGAMAVLSAASVWGQYDAGTSTALVVVDVVVGVVCCALMPVLRRRPVAGAAGLAVLAAVSWAATPAATLGTVYVAWRRRLWIAVLVGSLGVITHVVRGVWRPIGGLPVGWWVLLVVLGEAALVAYGALAQARAALIRSLRERADRAEAEQGRRLAEARAAERRRIAGEMHDALAHRLSLVATYAGALEYRPDAAAERISQAAGVVRTGVHDALGELRDVIAVLREDDLADETGPQPTLADVSALVTESRQAGMVVHLQDTLADPGAVPGTVSRCAYWVVQEALTNARKHAGGKPVMLALSGRPGVGLTVEVRNPRPASASAPLVPGSGTGLIGLTERVRLAGGSLDHHMGDGEFCLRAWLPWTA